VFWTSKYFSTSDESPIFAVSNFVFYYLGLSSALKAPNQLVWLLLKNCQCLTFVCAIIYLCSEITHQLGLDLTPSLMSLEPQTVIIIAI
jgi:hypothetical protein